MRADARDRPVADDEVVGVWVGTNPQTAVGDVEEEAPGREFRVEPRGPEDVAQRRRERWWREWWWRKRWWRTRWRRERRRLERLVE